MSGDGDCVKIWAGPWAGRQEGHWQRRLHKVSDNEEDDDYDDHDDDGDGDDDHDDYDDYDDLTISKKKGTGIVN